MKIRGFLIEDNVKQKILYKHNVRADDIKEVISNNPYIFRASNDRYIAIGKNHRFITFVFEIKQDIAFIITAYPSSDAQRKLYKHKR